MFFFSDLFTEKKKKINMHIVHRYVPNSCLNTISSHMQKQEWEYV